MGKSGLLIWVSAILYRQIEEELGGWLYLIGVNQAIDVVFVKSCCWDEEMQWLDQVWSILEWITQNDVHLTMILVVTCCLPYDAGNGLKQKRSGREFDIDWNIVIAMHAATSVRPEATPSMATQSTRVTVGIDLRL